MTAAASQPVPAPPREERPAARPAVHGPARPARRHVAQAAGRQDEGRAALQAPRAVVEFADYRNYVIGDDLRFIDWNIYGRLDRLFLKLFLEEEDLSLYVLLDVSKSSDYGDPNKAMYIKRVAAALGYIGLVNYNRVSIDCHGRHDRRRNRRHARAGGA
jgi:uncharacterized protein (DUF58 family)